MKTIAIMNQKGGIGKTMTAASIAYLLGEEQGKKVLLVDADQQGNVSMLYDRSNGTKWLYITVTLDGVEYIGFSSISYLKAK